MFYLRNDTKWAKLSREQIPKAKIEVILSLERVASGQNKNAEENDRDVFCAYLSLEKIELK